jgi:hypothetical protein
MQTKELQALYIPKPKLVLNGLGINHSSSVLLVTIKQIKSFITKP